MGIPIQGADTTTKITRTTKNPPRLAATELIRLKTSACDFFERYSESTGTNAWLKAPSANKRRRKLGILLARKKASDASVAPKRRAITISLASPKNRENIVIEPVTPLALSRPSSSSALLSAFGSLTSTSLSTITGPLFA